MKACDVTGRIENKCSVLEAECEWDSLGEDTSKKGPFVPQLASPKLPLFLHCWSTLVFTHPLAGPGRPCPMFHYHPAGHGRPVGYDRDTQAAWGLCCDVNVLYTSSFSYLVMVEGASIT